MAKTVYASYESVDARPIFMVHLGCPARLGNGIRLIHQENDGSS